MSEWRRKRVVFAVEGKSASCRYKKVSPALCGTNFAKKREPRPNQKSSAAFFRLRDSILTATKTSTIILEIVGRFESIKFRSCYSALQQVLFANDFRPLPAGPFFHLPASKEEE
jgi:hypothetical protein